MLDTVLLIKSPVERQARLPAGPFSIRGDRPMLHLTGGVTFGVNIGDLLQLERAC